MAKPVIVSRTRGIEDYIVDNENGRFTPPGDIAQLREQILTLWEQPGEQVRLGENARQAVEETMNLDIYVRKVVQIIESAASTPSPTLIRV